jgi:hypothetical protein
MIQLGASEFFQGREADERHEDGYVCPICPTTTVIILLTLFENGWSLHSLVKEPPKLVITTLANSK